VKDTGSKKRSKSSKISQQDIKIKEKRAETEPAQEPKRDRSRKRVKRPKSTNSNKVQDGLNLPGTGTIDQMVNETLKSLGKEKTKKGSK